MKYSKIHLRVLCIFTILHWPLRKRSNKKKEKRSHESRTKKQAFWHCSQIDLNCDSRKCTKLRMDLRKDSCTQGPWYSHPRVQVSHDCSRPPSIQLTEALSLETAEITIAKQLAKNKFEILSERGTYTPNKEYKVRKIYIKRYVWGVRDKYWYVWVKRRAVFCGIVN